MAEDMICINAGVQESGYVDDVLVTAAVIGIFIQGPVTAWGLTLTGIGGRNSLYHSLCLGSLNLAIGQGRLPQIATV